MKYAGADWLELHNVKLSVFGRDVADVLGQAFLGIYHVDREVQRKNVDWSDPNRVAITLDRPLSTFDGRELTALVMLAHDRAIRLEVSGCGPHRVQLSFSRRGRRTGNMYERHPTLEAHVAALRSAIGLPLLLEDGEQP